MSEIDRCAPIFLIARQAPSAVAQDEDVYLTVAVAAPTFPDQVETEDIYLTGDFARPVVMMHVRFPLSLRNVEDLLAERGIDISHETVRFWWNRFGPMFAAEIRERRVAHMRGYPQWRWHLDEVFVKDNGKLCQARQCRFNASTMEAAGGQSFTDLVRPFFETPQRRCLVVNANRFRTSHVAPPLSAL
jgi:hypothetical protein